ncbi:hypothetical protein ACQEVI_17905 [Promicromonospora sp. CA-289599]|uniref:hypothetical protein n=1 Tax=Promicromonospora sp. CA-289599 TaxID=3240014 RepID=UPI003D8AC656
MTVFAEDDEDEEHVPAAVAAARDSGMTAVGISASRLGRLSPAGAEALATLWSEVGLVESVSEGVSLIGRRAALTFPRGDTRLPDVLVGHGDRLSIDAGTNRVLDQHRGKVTLDGGGVDRWRRAFDIRDAYCRVRGIDYGVLIAPDTFSVHAEDFSAFGDDSDDRPVRKILASPPDTARLVYPLAALRRSRERGIVCDTVDSHWSGFGAYIAYGELQEAMPRHLGRIPEAEVDVVHRLGTGDLGDKFATALIGEHTECFVRSPRSRRVWTNGVKNRGNMGLWVSNRQDLPRGVLFVDSYGWKLQRFLAESFSSMFVIHSPHFEWEVVEKYRPDVVVSLMAERFLIRPPDDHPAESAVVTAARKELGSRLPSLVEVITGSVEG